MEELGDMAMLSAYLDGDLEDADKRVLEKRLASDPALRAELESIRSAVELLRTHGPVRAPHDLMASVLAEVAREPIPVASRWSWLRRPFGIPMEALLVVATVLVVAVVTIQPNGEPEVPSPLVGAPQGGAAPASAVPSELEANQDAANQDNTAYDKSTALDGNTANTALEGFEEVQRALPKHELGKLSTGGSDIAIEGLPGSGYAQQTDAPTQTAVPQTWNLIPYKYSVRTADPTVLARLMKVAEEYGGRVTDGRAPVSTVELQPGANVLYVELPAERLGSFEKQLARLGTVVRTDAEGPSLAPSEAMRVELEVYWESEGIEATPMRQIKKVTATESDLTGM